MYFINYIDVIHLVMLEAPPHPADLKAYAKVRTYFATCMAEGQDTQRHSTGQFIAQHLNNKKTNTQLFHYKLYVQQ